MFINAVASAGEAKTSFRDDDVGDYASSRAGAFHSMHIGEAA